MAYQSLRANGDQGADGLLERGYKLLQSRAGQFQDPDLRQCYLQGIPAIAIMKITGHRTEKSFLRYIRLTQEENANNLLNHPFFK
jgi:hypothetical protein